MALNPSFVSELARLNQRLKGDVSVAETDRLLYSTDASIYQQSPLAVARPAGPEDCIKLLEFAQQHKIAVIPRAGGTSLAGQVVGEAMIIDVSRYMTDIIAVNKEEQTALVQPGVIVQSLNQTVKPMGLKFAPDPSTLNRCTVSGVIGNNAWGAHAPAYGSTLDHLQETEMVLPNGDLIHTAPLDDDVFTGKLTLPGKEGDIYRSIDAIIRQHQALIANRYPNRQDLICNAGYALHELAAMRPWNRQGPKFNLSALLCGSEGTLGLVTKAKLKLVPLPKHSVIMAAHFHSIDAALHAVSPALALGACAVELLDDYLLNLTLHNPEQAKHRYWVHGQPEAVLLVEFYGDNAQELNDRIQQLIEEYRAQQSAYAFPIIDTVRAPQAWSLRRAALGLLMGMPGSKKAVSFIEDSAVPVKHLPAFVAQVQALMRQHATPCVYYGSVSMGLIHLRPLLDLNNTQDKQTFTLLAGEVAQLLIRYNGTMSAKHGDGIVRSPFIEPFFGATISQCLHTIKSAFDPDNVLNPHKIVDPGPVDQNLRYQSVPLANLTTGFSWQPDGLLAAVEQCNGAGACRKQAGNGTMCPSYMATLEELHSTRGRANTLRQTLQQHQALNHEALASINNAMRFCLSCKGCRSECPANVDMAKLKAECLYQSQQLQGTALRTRLLSQLDTISRLASGAPSLSNALLGLPIVNRLLGFSPRRQLPKLAAVRFSQWFAHHTVHKNAGRRGQVILLNDVFSEFYEPAVGRSAVDLLEYWGFSIVLSPCFASARLCISLGMLQQARNTLTATVHWLDSRVNEATQVIGLEPSELLTYRDEARALLVEPAQIRFLHDHQHRFQLFDEFVSDHHGSFCKDDVHNENPLNLAVHVHCHQKSLSDADKCISALQITTHAKIHTLASGCCGMAGLFGYQPANYDVSRQIAELVLLPSIRQLPHDTRVVATGASCRQQIQDFLNIKAYHPAEILRQQLIVD